MLTGKSLPVEKRTNPLKNAESIPLLELENLCFMGTNVVSGSAKAIVVNTGSDTYFGSIGKSIAGEKPPTGFDIGIKRRSEEHTSELQSRGHLVCRLMLERKN